MSAPSTPDGMLKPTGGPHVLQRAADHAGVPDRGVERADEPGEHPYRMPLRPVPALLAVLGAGYLLVTLAMAASVRDIMIIIGLLALSVILYCISGRLSPAFQKL